MTVGGQALAATNKDHIKLVDTELTTAPAGHDPLISICCGKQKPTMSPLRKQGSRAKKLDSRFRGNDKYCFRNND